MNQCEGTGVEPLNKLSGESLEPFKTEPVSPVSSGDLKPPKKNQLKPNYGDISPYGVSIGSLFVGGVYVSIVD